VPVATSLLALLMAASGASPTALGRARIVTVAELAASLPSVDVLDAREEKEYRAGHVPGSRHADWRDFTLERAGAWNLLTGDPARWGKVAEPDAALEARLRGLGLSNRRTIVVVGSAAGWGEEGRIAWNLLYWGADDVALLDGGFPAWRAAGEAVEAKSGPARAGSFAVTPRPARRIELADLAASVAARSRPLLDARTPEEFAGRTMTGQKRGGHLPGARLVPQKELFSADGRYVDAATLRRLAGDPPGSPVTYCTGGVRSALLALLLEARLGVVAANYDGSVWEWSSHPELPLVTAAAR